MRWLPAAALLAGMALTATAARAAVPAPYPAIYAFGDSLTDSGNDYITSGRTVPISPPYWRGRWSNGPTWVEDLAYYWGLPPIAANLAGGTNYAAGGACTGATSVHAANDTDLPAKLSQFLREVPAPVPDALYTLDIGTNDIQALFVDAGISDAAAKAVVDQAVANATMFVAALFNAGMRNLLLLTTPDMSVLPSASGQSPGYLQQLKATDIYYNTQLIQSVKALAAQDGFSVTVMDLFALSEEAASDPTAFGFANGSDPCWTGSNDAYDGTLCAPTRAGQDKYVFWDHGHPSARSHAIIAGVAATLLARAPAY